MPENAQTETIEPFYHLRKDAGIIIDLPVQDDAGRFHMWRRNGSDWIRIQPSDIIESDYFAKAPAAPGDVCFSFVNFLMQHCRNVKALSLWGAVRSDMHNLGTCFRKLELYHEKRTDKSCDTRRFVITEIEYVIGVCRSLYDLQQRIAKELWGSVELLDKSVHKQNLPSSFADMALTGDGARSIVELRTKYGLSPALASFYFGEADFFRKLRKFRNDIEHLGLTPEFIFATPKGFAVNADSKPFAQFGVWKEETFLPNKLAPLKPVIAHIVKETLFSMGRFVEALTKEIKFPDEIAPGYTVYMRGRYTDRLLQLAQYVESDQWYPESGPKNA